MATEAQITANRWNAGRSTGPRTEAGKAVSRLNATTHGLTGAMAGPEAEDRDEFNSRRVAWAESVRPATEAAGLALDRAIAATFRIDRCQVAIEAEIDAQAARARLAWDLDRRAEAAALAGRLHRAPADVASALARTRHGALLMIDRWTRLGAALDAEPGGDAAWTDDQTSLALDLLGVPVEVRTVRTELDAPAGVDPVEHRRALVAREVAALRDDLEASLGPLDDLDRAQVEAGRSSLLSKPVGLLLRYERDAWARYRSAMREASRGQGRDDAPAEPRPTRAAVRPMTHPLASIMASANEVMVDALDVVRPAPDARADAPHQPAARPMNRKRRRALERMNRRG